MSQFTGEEKIQLFILFMIFFTLIRIVMKMPKKIRIIFITIALILFAFDWYMLTYQEDLVLRFRDFFNLAKLD